MQEKTFLFLIEYLFRYLTLNRKVEGDIAYFINYFT